MGQGPTTALFQHVGWGHDFENQTLIQLQAPSAQDGDIFTMTALTVDLLPGENFDETAVRSLQICIAKNCVFEPREKLAEI